MKKKWSGERLETFIYGNVSVEHLHRYALSSMFVKGKIVLDIASGEGYGSFLMSKAAKKVIGVDIDNDAVDQAKIKYKNDNLSFLTGSAENIPLEDNSIDVLVSFETIEHHDKHEEMFLEIKRVLKPNGMLIMSSPDKKYYSDLQKNNPYHIKELYLEEFENLAKRHFTNTKTYFQNCVNGSSIIAPVNSFENLKIFSGNFEEIYPKKLPALYNIIIASEGIVDEVELFIFDGQVISNKINEDNINYIRSSTTFRLGSYILKPFIKIKNSIKR
ncbi:bifunctional 2-polyprenyl-6-hydroxyphenol methylase/3-demethylubiquinol 3-O-methyltransferase UbiG [Lacinutrix sp. Bg11-31]|uniref:class I SAM-dependent methyltransferase n=1 Tax=Lacinutrix sp. Bg11-31 TaxID=2057808 RepID=UPI000C316B4C|nr:class I SAM-dependent methyltransferase [Lacinutrix sp. Bg11-31]AUC82076.1 hypothetical protein CW733_08030 [Lacinutrix sp. Bg11-31]